LSISNSRLKDLEDTNKLLEEARTELASRDLNLEEKLSVLKEDRDRLTSENVLAQKELERLAGDKVASDNLLLRKTEEYDLQVKELKGSLEKAAEQNSKMKQQFQVKLKSFKEQIKNAAEQVHAHTALTQC